MVRQQIAAVAEVVGIENICLAVIAYEPVWAIGTGETATPQQAQEVHADIRAQLGHQGRFDTVAIWWQCQANNANALFAQPDIDGGLVGGASLEAQQFLDIAQQLTEQKVMEQFILVFHFILALALIGLILLQQGKGAEAGASFGAGASQNSFCSAGGWSFFSKLTAMLATAFFVTSLSLAIVAKNRTVIEDDLLPELQELPLPATTESSIPELTPDTDAGLPSVDDSQIPVQ